MDTNTDLLVRVDIREEGGWFFASSDDVPGLHVGGETLALTRQYVMQATRLLFKYNREMDVDVVPAERSDDVGDVELNVEKFIVRQLTA